MDNLYIINDTFGYIPIALNIISFIAIISAILVITTINPIISVLYLIILFFTIAAYLISIGIVFLGLSYLLVYVGAISILFLFIIMLINIRVSELSTETNNSIPLIFIVALTFQNAYNIIYYKKNMLHDSFMTVNDYIIKIVTYNDWENNLNEFDQIASISNIIYTNYYIWFIIVSIILLLAMIGAIVITIKRSSLSYEEKIVK